jgi:hypothetical protein
MDFTVVPIYCGFNFRSGSGDSNFKADEMDAAVAKLCGVSDYFEGLRPFGAQSVTAHIGGFFTDSDVPASWADDPGQPGFTDNDIRDLLQREVLSKPNLQPTAFGNRTPVYIVIIKKGQKSKDHTGVAVGNHDTFAWSQPPIEVLWAWVYQGDDRDGTTPTVAHEVVEAIAARLGYGERCDPCVNAGLTAKVNDIPVDPYLDAFGRCIAPYNFSRTMGTAACMAWKDSESATIWWSTLSTFPSEQGAPITKWDHPAFVPGVGTSHGPSMAFHKDSLWMAWKGMNDDEHIYWSRFVNSQWSAQRVIAGAGTSSHPSLASFDGNLYAFWKGAGDDTHVWYSIFTGSDWSEQFMMSDRATSQGVALVAGHNLHMFWRGAAEDQTIWWSQLAPGRMFWTDQQPLQGWTTDTPSAAPALQFVSGPDRLLLTWKGSDGDSMIWQSAFDGGSWSPQTPINDVATDYGPAVAGDRGGKLWRVWKGFGDDTAIWWSFSSDGGSSWSPQQAVMDSIGRDGVFNARTSHQPSIVILP